MVRAERNDPSRVVSLDERDHAILLTLLEHKVLTTDQIKNLFFRSFRRCQHRMKELRDIGFVSSFTPGRGFGEGRPPACFILTKAGLAEIAEAKGVQTSDLSWIPDHSYRTNQLLAHRLGVNACLVTWRPEHWVRTRATDVKPDGFGRYLHPGAACEFYLEYDRGTEAFGALARKLEGYLRLAANWTREQELLGFPNLLLIVPEEVREGEVGSALRHAIGIVQVRRSLGTSFPLYVAGEEHLTELGVLGPAWKHLPTDGDRVSLLDLPVRPRDLYRSTRCLGRYFTDADAGHRRRISPASTTPRFRALPPTCPLIPRRANARGLEGGHDRRHDEIGTASADKRDAQGATPSRTTLAHPGAGQPEPPEPGALRPLARVLVDLVLALDHEDEEDEPWTR